jgi:hypothetical protein
MIKLSNSFPYQGSLLALSDDALLLHSTSIGTNKFAELIISNMASALPLSPAFYGCIASTQDALLLFEACLGGAFNHAAHRPCDRERVSLIKTGNVFIYEENSSQITRWTDGVTWSPSRILVNFIFYLELKRPFPLGEKRSKKSLGSNKPKSFGTSDNGINGVYSATIASSSFDYPSTSSLSKETERSSIGSLIDSYDFKEEGLVKKTISVTVAGVSHYLISYYTLADVMNNIFTTHSKDPRFQHITVRPALLTKQHLRRPIDVVDSMDYMGERSFYVRNGYEMVNQTISTDQYYYPLPRYLAA